MVFSDSVSKQGIVEETHFFANTTSTTYDINQITRNVNRALDRIAFLIQSSDQLWQFDDQNQTDLPIAVTDLVSGQNDYAIDTTFLKILKVQYADSAGIFRDITPINVDDPSYTYLTSNPTTGTPQRYDKDANSVLVYPAPNYDKNGGLRIMN